MKINIYLKKIKNYNCSPKPKIQETKEIILDKWIALIRRWFHQNKYIISLKKGNHIMIKTVSYMKEILLKNKTVCFMKENRIKN